MPVKRLIFPAGGLSTKSAYQQQPPFTTRQCLNVLPEEGIDGRDRGGSRPGLVKDYILGATPTALGSGNPVNLLASVRKVGGTTPGKFIQDDFTNEDAGVPETEYWDNTEDTTNWTVIYGSGTYVDNLSVDTTRDTLENADTQSDNHEGLVMIASSGVGEFVGTSDINWAEPVRLIATPKNNHGTYGAVWLRKFEYHFFMDDTGNTDPINDSVTITLIYETLGDYVKESGFIREYSGGSLIGQSTKTDWFTPETVPSHDILIEPHSVESDGKRTFSVWYKRARRIMSTAIDVSRFHRIGLTMARYESDILTPELSDFSLQYSSAAHATLPPEVIVAASNGTLYREETQLGTVAAVANDAVNGIEYTETVSARQRLGKLYIADYELLTDQRSNTTDTIGIVDATGILTHTVPVTDDWDFSALDVQTYDRIDITDASNDDAIGTWKLSAVGTDTVTIADWLTLGGDVTAVKYRILCGPKVYDPDTDTLAVWHNTTRTADDAMAIPIACKIVSSYKDRMVLAGDGTGIVYMSRNGDADDWDFSASNTDQERAIGLGASNSDVGGLPEAVTAIIPHSDDYFLISSKNTFWVLRGDPGSGGVLDNLSQDIGCISRFAWCKDPQGGAFILTTNGIYYQPYGATVSPQKLSKQTIPQSLLSVDLEVIEPFLVYSLKYDGAFIFLAPKDERPMESWFFDSESAGFFPIQYGNQSHHPRSVLSYKPETQAFTKVLLGGKDGFIRSIGGTTDDGDTIVSQCAIGPVSLGVRGGFLTELRAILAEDSGDVDWSLTAGDSAEDTLSTDPVSSGTWSEGHNYFDRPNAVGRAAFLDLSSSAQWAMEVVEARIEQSREHLPL